MKASIALSATGHLANNKTKSWISIKLFQQSWLFSKEVGGESRNKCWFSIQVFTASGYVFLTLLIKEYSVYIEMKSILTSQSLLLQWLFKLAIITNTTAMQISFLCHLSMKTSKLAINKETTHNQQTLTSLICIF